MRVPQVGTLTYSLRQATNVSPLEFRVHYTLLCTKLDAMTRAELLRALIRQAKSNGFEFRKWYISRMMLPWTSFDESVQTLSEQRRYYSLLFAHEFAHPFWLEGSKMTFVVPTNRFTRILRDGSSMTVERKGHTRRTVLPDAWRFHLKAMAVADDPLRYIRKFLLIEEDLAGIQALSDEETDAAELSNFYEDLSENASEEDFGANG
jgi:hypothetical protein